MSKTRIISLIVCAVMIFSSVAVNVSAASADDMVAEVSCGDCVYELATKYLNDAQTYITQEDVYTYESRMALKDVVDQCDEYKSPDHSEYIYHLLVRGIENLVLIENYVIGNVIATDGLNIKDATAIQKHLAGIINLDTESLRLADTDGNGDINIKDVTVLQKYLAEMDVDSVIGQSPAKDTLPDIVDIGVKIGSEIYDCRVGETITYVAELQAAELFENIQAVVNYDSDKLELIRIYSDDPDIEDWEVEGEVRCPNFEMVFFNADFEDEVRFNASNIRGYDFTEEKTLVTLDFVVKSTERSEISLDVEYMTVKGDGSQKYFYNSEAIITDGIGIREYAPMYPIHEVCPNEGVN